MSLIASFMYGTQASWTFLTYISSFFFYPFQVNDENLVVKSYDGTIIESQLVEVDNVTGYLRKFYVEAYLGITTVKTPKYWLVFQASAAPMGWNSYFISRPTGAGDSCPLKNNLS